MRPSVKRGGFDGKTNALPGREAFRAITTVRNRRSVWTIATRPYGGAHFAVFPPDLVRPCIRAGASEHGACGACGAPWRRVVERADAPEVPPSHVDRYGTGEAGVHRKIGGSYQQWLEANPTTTVGWEPTCSCDPVDVVPCTVLDPFNGAGTTGLVALQEGRRYVGIELNPEYAELTRERLEPVAAQPILF